MRNQVIIRLTNVPGNCQLPTDTYFDKSAYEYVAVRPGASLLVKFDFTIQVHGASPLIGIKYVIETLDLLEKVDQKPKNVRRDFKYAPFNIENGRMRWTTTGIIMDSGTTYPGPLHLEVNDKSLTRLTATAVRSIGPELEQSTAVSFMSLDPSRLNFHMKAAYSSRRKPAARK